MMKHLATILLLLAMTPMAVLAGSREAAESVRQGVEQFQSQQYEAAAKSFTDADRSLPEVGADGSVTLSDAPFAEI